MTDYDAALRFDAALDRFVQGDHTSEDPLMNTARAIHQIDASQRGVPSDAFRAQLRGVLSGDGTVEHLNGHHPVAEGTIPVPLPERPAQLRSSHRWLAIAAALLLLLVGGGAIVLEGIGLRNDSEPSAIPAVSFASPDVDEQATGSPGATDTALSLAPLVPMALSDGTLYRIERDLGDAKFTGLRAYRTEDSKRLWEVADADFGHLLVAAGELVFTTLKPDGSESGQIVAYDAGSGDVVWTMPSGGTVTGLAESDGVLYAVDSTGSVAAIDAETGVLQWSSQIDGGAEAPSSTFGSAVGVAPDYVVAMTAVGTVAVLHRIDGAVAWTRDGYDPAATGFALTDDAMVLFSRREQVIDPTQPVATPNAVAVVMTPVGGQPTNDPEATIPTEPWVDVSWEAVGYDLASGGFYWSGGGQAVNASPAALDGVVAYAGTTYDRGPGNHGLVDGIMGNTPRQPGTVILDLPAQHKDETWTQLGTWTPPDGSPPVFVAVSNDGLLTLISPRRLGPVEGLSSENDPYDGAFVELGQPVISQPIGDESGIWVTLADGTLLSIHPDRLNQTSQHRQLTATAEPSTAIATPIASSAASPVQYPSATAAPITFTGSGIDWSVTPPDGARGQSAPGTIANGVFYRVLGTADSQPLAQAIDLTNGSVLWEKVLDIWPRAIAATDDGFLIAGDDRSASENGLAFAMLDRATGDERWQAPLHQLPVELLAVDSQALVLGAQNLLTAFDLADQTIAWETDLTSLLEPSADEPGLLVYSGGRLAVSNGVVAVVADEGSIVAVDLQDGSHRWTYPHLSEGRTRLAVVDGMFTVVAMNPAFSGGWVSWRPWNSTPIVEALE